jgi:hypothetical protein
MRGAGPSRLSSCNGTSPASSLRAAEGFEAAIDRQHLCFVEGSERRLVSSSGAT